MQTAALHLTHVVLTRPRGQNKNLLECLSGRGLSCIELPMLEIAMLDAAEAIAAAHVQIGSLHQYDYALFVSANAVESAAKFCRQQGVEWPAELCCIGMGAATEKAIEHNGWHLLPQGAESVASLSSELMMQQPWAQLVKGLQVVIVKGEGGREYMQQTLADRGAHVAELLLYRRERPVYSNEFLSRSLCEVAQSAQSSAIVLASADTLNNWHHALEQSGLIALKRQLNLVVPSQRVAELAREKGFSEIRVASGASNDAFIQALGSI